LEVFGINNFLFGAAVVGPEKKRRKPEKKLKKVLDEIDWFV
jgi:hypothetical protein